MARRLSRLCGPSSDRLITAANGGRTSRVSTDFGHRHTGRHAIHRQADADGTGDFDFCAARIGAVDRRVVITALGIAQILAWGTSFYFPAVFATPIVAETGWSLGFVVGGAIVLVILLYGAGYGISWIGRGTLPLALFGPARFPRLMGKLAFPSLIVQALAPSLGALLIETSGTNATIAVLTLLAFINVLLIGGLWWLCRTQPIDG